MAERNMPEYDAPFVGRKKAALCFLPVFHDNTGCGFGRNPYLCIILHIYHMCFSFCTPLSYVGSLDLLLPSILFLLQVGYGRESRGAGHGVDYLWKFDEVAFGKHSIWIRAFINLVYWPSVGATSAGYLSARINYLIKAFFEIGLLVLLAAHKYMGCLLTAPAMQFEARKWLWRFRFYFRNILGYVIWKFWTVYF